MDYPDDRWDRLQPPHDPTDGLSGYRKWMILHNEFDLVEWKMSGSIWSIIIGLKSTLFDWT